MKKITIILPIHKLEGLYIDMFNNALASIQNFYEDVKLLIVCPSDIKTTIDTLDLGTNLEVSFQINKGETDFCSQINLGIDNTDTEWFSILEIDDEYTPVWLKSMNEYVKTFTDVDVFLSLTKDVTDEGKFLSFVNESIWAFGFSERQGYLDNEVLLDFQNYQTSGGLYRTEVIKEQGKLKENIKLTFSYEFLLRLTHNGIRIMSVPKIGYQHVSLRDDSLFSLYQKDDTFKLTEKEAKFWLDTAKKEFFFKNKRDVNYTEA
jgi:hypothetical protein